MLGTAVSLALLTTTSFYIVYSKLPRKIRRFLEKYHLATDVAALVGTYLLLGQTLTALIAGALVCLLTSALLHIANNQDDFLILFDLRDWVKEKLAEVNETIKEFGKEYKIKRSLQIEEKVSENQ